MWKGIKLGGGKPNFITGVDDNYYANGYLDIYIIHESHNIINLKISLQCLIAHLINSP